jgi:hypothetical protein
VRQGDIPERSALAVAGGAACGDHRGDVNGATPSAVLALGAAALVSLVNPASKDAMNCGPATASDASAPIGRAAPVGDVLWLGIYPFTSGYPTKVIVEAQRSIGRVSIRGWNCATAAPLRFWYRESGPPFQEVPVRAAVLRKTGDLQPTFGPWSAQAARGGYFMFWRGGRWKIVCYRRGRRIASAVVVASPR